MRRCACAHSRLPFKETHHARTDQRRRAQVRFEYEHTERPVEEICAQHGFSSGTLRDRVRRWGWTRRRAPVPPEGPSPAPAIHSNEAAPAPSRGDAASLAPRLQETVARMLPAVEAIIGRLGAQPGGSRELERSARALGSVMRTLRDLNTQLRQDEASHGRAGDGGDTPAEMDEFRRDLARRIEALAARTTAEAEEAERQEAEC